MEGRLYQLILLVQRYADFALIYHRNGGSVRSLLYWCRGAPMCAPEKINDYYGRTRRSVPTKNDMRGGRIQRSP